MESVNWSTPGSLLEMDRADVFDGVMHLYNEQVILESNVCM